MTTPAQNQWAQYLESATPREIRQMAEYAIDHIENLDELMAIEFYIKLTLMNQSRPHDADHHNATQRNDLTMAYADPETRREKDREYSRLYRERKYGTDTRAETTQKQRELQKMARKQQGQDSCQEKGILRSAQGRDCR